MRHYLLTSAAALVMLAACGGGADQASEPIAATPIEPAPAAETERPSETPGSEAIPARAQQETTGPAADIVVTVEQEMLSASAKIDGKIADFSPALAQRFKAEAEMAFEKAEAIVAEEAGTDYASQHMYQYDYMESASVGDVISVDYFEMVHTGGAHPNYLLGGILHDRAAGEDVSPSALLSEAGTAKMKALVMEKLASEKLKRLSMQPQDMPAMREEVAEVFPVETEFWFGQVILVPSSEAAQFGGLVVRFSPYDVGSYAEGGYDLLVSASELDGLLSERFAPMFGGAPIYDDSED